MTSVKASHTTNSLDLAMAAPLHHLKASMVRVPHLSFRLAGWPNGTRVVIVTTFLNKQLAAPSGTCQLSQLMANMVPRRMILVGTTKEACSATVRGKQATELPVAMVTRSPSSKAMAVLLLQVLAD